MHSLSLRSRETLGTGQGVLLLGTGLQDSLTVQAETLFRYIFMCCRSGTPGLLGRGSTCGSMPFGTLVVPPSSCLLASVWNDAPEWPRSRAYQRSHRKKQLGMGLLWCPRTQSCPQRSGLLWELSRVNRGQAMSWLLVPSAVEVGEPEPERREKET